MKQKRLIGDERLSVLCTEVPEFLSSGITAGEGFLILSEQETDPELKAVFEKIYQDTAAGGAVSAALRVSGVFPEYLLRMTAVAEKTGTLEPVFRELADYYRRQDELRRTVKSAVEYPLLLLFIVLAVFFVFLTEVLPVFSRVFDQIGARMLPVAQAFLSAGLWLAQIRWELLGVLLAAGIAALVIRLVPAWNDRVYGRFSMGGEAGRRITEARTASALSLAVSGASDITEALQLACDFAAGFGGEAQLRACRDAVAGGESFARAAQNAGLFEPLYCRMLAVGERTGSTDAMMRDVAHRAQADMERAVDRRVGRIEPITVVVLSVCVGLLLLSVMLPLVGIMSAL